MVVGDISEWNDFFPWHLLPQVFDLVTETWDAWDKPAPDAKETDISRRFRARLKQAKDYKTLPFFIMREDPEDDFETGEELGRKDIIFLSHGGPICTPEDAAYINEHTDCVGFVGASSLERLAVEKSLTDLTNKFKTIPVRKQSLKPFQKK